MLHDSVTVDTEAALELWKEATKLASAAELDDLGERLGRKSARFQALLGADAIDALDEAGLRELAGWIFTLRRKADRVLRANGVDRLREELAALLHGDGAVDARLDRFLAGVRGMDRPVARALATEALHFTFPDRHWLWTSWIWNPEARTGALPLVVDADLDAPHAGEGQLYQRVGRAIAVVDRAGQAAGWARGRFGTDVFLACVYAVYMYTVFRLKLSQEFNRILPELPELALRVLGVKAAGGSDGR
jgi:hypothetical protein